MTLSITTTFRKCPYAECRILFNVGLNVIMLNVIMLNVVMLSVFMLSVVMLNVAMLNVPAPIISNLYRCNLPISQILI
jgi:hypothetical protein